jgi:hypothetical protein
MGGESFIRMRVKLPGACVPFNGEIELLGVEYLEPSAKPRKLARGKLFDGLLDVFGGGHSEYIAVGRRTGKSSSAVPRRAKAEAHCAELAAVTDYAEFIIGRAFARPVG